MCSIVFFCEGHWNINSQTASWPRRDAARRGLSNCWRCSRSSFLRGPPRFKSTGCFVASQGRGASRLDKGVKTPYPTPTPLSIFTLMQKGGFVYITTNPLRTVLYTGVTSNLIGRIQKHKSKFYPNSFSARYNVTILVYYAFFPTIVEAIMEEKRIKAGSRKQKMDLINSINPFWEDLWDKEVSKW